MIIFYLFYSYLELDTNQTNIKSIKNFGREIHKCTRIYSFVSIISYLFYHEKNNYHIFQHINILSKQKRNNDYEY
jgi:hypothetical protein